MSELRVTPEEVVDAYRKTGMRPIRGAWRNGRECGCPLAALALAAEAGSPVFWSLERFGSHYAVGFINGVDKPDQDTVFNPRWDIGFKDGKAAWAAVVAAGLA